MRRASATNWIGAGQPSIARVNLLSDQLALGSNLRFDQATGDFYAKLSMRRIEDAGRHNLEDRGRSEGQSSFPADLRAYCPQNGSASAAADLLLKSAGELERAGLTSGSEYLDLCDTFQEMGKDDYALESALRARESFEKPPERPRSAPKPHAA